MQEYIKNGKMEFTFAGKVRLAGIEEKKAIKQINSIFDYGKQ